MSGILKGDSIYKNGGGGGGYKDGGQLVDGDFIKVENNTVSSYDNVSRDPVNFYFEVEEGEVLNSVVELTTAVNATIHVYILQNGFYFPLGNVGGDTVNAGYDYNLSIIGNSFILEVVTNSGIDPEYVNLLGINYPCKKVNGLLWLTENLKNDIGTNELRNGHRYYSYDSFENIDLDGFRLPTVDEINLLDGYLGSNAGSKIKSVFGWASGGNGNNESGLNVFPFGYLDAGNDLQFNTYYGRFFLKPNNNLTWAYITLSYNSTAVTHSTDNKPAGWKMNVRLVKEI